MEGIMPGNSVEKFIDSVSFFDAFNEIEKHKFLSDQTCFVKYKENELVFTQGEQGDTLYLVLHGKVGLFRVGDIKTVKGRVSLKKEEEKHITNLNPGAIFGEVSMLTNSKRNVTARIFSKESVLMKVSKKLIDSLNHLTQIKFHRQLLLSLAIHLDNMNSQYVDLKYEYDQHVK
jgi:CRP/FNR family transcriptional regulator, cyclic AMP receptor protein